MNLDNIHLAVFIWSSCPFSRFNYHLLTVSFYFEFDLAYSEFRGNTKERLPGSKDVFLHAPVYILFSCYCNARLKAAASSPAFSWLTASFGRDGAACWR